VKEEGLTTCVLWWWSTREGGYRQTSHRRHRRASVCCRYIDAIVDPRQQWPYVGIVVVTVAHLGSRSLSLSSFVQVGAIVVVVSATPSSEIYQQGWLPLLCFWHPHSHPLLSVPSSAEVAWQKVFPGKSFRLNCLHGSIATLTIHALAFFPISLKDELLQYFMTFWRFLRVVGRNSPLSWVPSSTSRENGLKSIDAIGQHASRRVPAKLFCQ